MTLPEHGGRGPALPGPQRACFSAARAARAASGSDGDGTSPQRDFGKFARVPLYRVHLGCLKTGLSDRQMISFRCHGS